MSKYVPDKWVLVEIIEGQTKLHKILASWVGGFVGREEWRLSSGITSMQEFDDHYEFINHSGSVYTCYKHTYGMSSYTAAIYSGFVNKAGDLIRLLTKEEAFDKTYEYERET